MYLLDANVFIEAKNRYYDFDICPGFWEWIDGAVRLDKVASITRVYDELKEGGDTLAEWVKDRYSNGLFLDDSKGDKPMPHITGITPDQATGEVAELFKQVKAGFGTVPEPLQLFANHPASAKAVFEGFSASMTNSPLSQPFFAWIRYLVADHTHCTHCIDVNAAMLLEMGVSQDTLAEARQDASAVPLPEAEKALLLTCVKMVRDDSRLEKHEIDNLKALGHQDADLIAAFHHAAHSHAVDLMINAFGL